MELSLSECKKVLEAMPDEEPEERESKAMAYFFYVMAVSLRDLSIRVGVSSPIITDGESI